MSDIVSLNRQFLIIARNEARSKSGELVTGLPRRILERIAELTLDQIDVIAEQAGLSLITFRLSGSELDQLLSLNKTTGSAYVMNILSKDD